jgi:hypothetical protein
MNQEPKPDVRPGDEKLLEPAPMPYEPPTVQSVKLSKEAAEALT